MKKKVLITGASGFLGSRFCELFRAAGHEVTGLDIRGTPQGSQASSFEYLQKDLAELELQDFSDHGFDLVVHAAAQVPIAGSEVSFWRNNVLASEKLYLWSQQKKVKQFIFISSSSIFGAESNTAITETTSPVPFESYGCSKKQAEDRLLELSHDGDSPILSIIRPRTILGPGRLGIFSFFFEGIKNHRPVIMAKLPEQKYQFVHVDDVAGLTLAVAERNLGGIFHSGSRKLKSFPIEITELIDAAKSQSRIVFAPLLFFYLGQILCYLPGFPLKKWHFMAYMKSYAFDLRLTTEKTGFNAKYSNGEILLETYLDYLHRGDSKKEDSVHQKPLLKNHWLNFFYSLLCRWLS